MDFIYDNSGKPYALKYDGTTYYYVLNLQGDVMSIITHWGESYGSYTYDAWGNVISQSGSIASLNPIRYRGYYYDAETGLYYLGSRYYDPAVKRFINADGAALATINPYSDGLTDKNYFAYCDNNPVSRSDDGGEFWSELLYGVAIVAGVTAVAAFVVATGGVGAMAVAGGGVVLGGAITSTTAMAVSVSAAAVSVSAAVCAKSASQYANLSQAKAKTKEKYDPDPYGRAGQKKQGRERKEKKKENGKWKGNPNKKAQPLKKHTPGRDHRKY